ncbi:MAG: hypothetical protein ABI461_05950 [Polyangiaceae bacterium]
MKTRKTSDEKETLRALEHDAGGAAAGAIVGATAGAIAGPAGSIAGAIVGALAGGIAVAAIERSDKANEAHGRELDETIGVSGGELGAPNLKHPAAKIGAYSGSSTGGATVATESPSEGPFQAPE